MSDPTNGVDLYTTNGYQLLSNSLAYDQSGNSDITYVGPVSFDDGSVEAGYGLGDTQAITARSDYTSINWINSADATNTATLPLYALSGVLTVPAPVPEPSSLAPRHQRSISSFRLLCAAQVAVPSEH